MPPQRATLLQVAQRAGVSRSTASFVLAGRHLDMRISEDARQRVLRAAQELDYRPNLMARSLRTKVTRTIALVSDTIASDPYAGRAIHGSLAAAVAHGHLLFIGETEGDPVVEEKLISDFLDRQVDAFIYASMFTRYVRLPKLLKGRRVVLLNCLTRGARQAHHAVIPDGCSPRASGWPASGSRSAPRTSGWPARSTATGGRIRRTRRCGRRWTAG
jgi:LacI family transcriptional regulator